MNSSTLRECCDFVVAAVDGGQGWMTEVISIILIVIAFNFVAKWALKKLHRRFEQQKKHWKDSFVRALYLPLSYYVWFFAAIHMLQLLGSQLLNSPFFSMMHVWLKIGAILALSWFALRWKKNLVEILVSKSRKNEIAMDTGKIDVINKLVTVFILFLTILMLLEATNRSINTLIAFGGVGGLAIAFASQEIIANFFGGLMIYTTHPFAIGDWINLPEKNIEGHVEEIGWYMTRIRTFDKRPIYIPNSIFSKLVVMTPSRMTHRQFKEVLGLRYSDMPVVKEVIEDIKDFLRKHTGIDQRQKIIVTLNAFGTYSLDIQISAYTNTTSSEGYAEVRQDLLFNIYAIVQKRSAELAVPVTYVELKNQIS